MNIQCVSRIGFRGTHRIIILKHCTAVCTARQLRQLLHIEGSQCYQLNVPGIHLMVLWVSALPCASPCVSVLSCV